MTTEQSRHLLIYIYASWNYIFFSNSYPSNAYTYLNIEYRLKKYQWPLSCFHGCNIIALERFFPKVKKNPPEHQTTFGKRRTIYINSRSIHFWRALISANKMEWMTNKALLKVENNKCVIISKYQRQNRKLSSSQQL